MCAYYPEGGRHDVLTSFDTIEEVMNEIKSKTLRCDWYDVLYLEERRWIDFEERFLHW